MLTSFPFQYQVRFSTVYDGNDFAAEHNAYIEWINDTDEFNRAYLFCKKNIYYDLNLDEVSFNSTFLKINHYLKRGDNCHVSLLR